MRQCPVGSCRPCRKLAAEVLLDDPRVDVELARRDVEVDERVDRRRVWGNPYGCTSSSAVCPRTPASRWYTAFVQSAAAEIAQT
jgi:hypothetical protein